jgi:hypothetical protein
MAEIHDLVAPYALDALDSDEELRFEAHLETCERCVTELALFTESAADVARSVAVSPPDRVKEAVLAAIAGDDESASVTRLEGRRSTGWLVAGVAAAVALVFFGLWLVTDNRLDDATRVAEVYEASDARVVEIETGNGPARFVYSASLERGVFHGGELVALPESDVYQLWLIDGDGPVPAGTLSPGEADVLVESVEPGLTLAMTVETSPGAEAPTSDPMFASEL